MWATHRPPLGPHPRTSQPQQTYPAKPNSLGSCSSLFLHGLASDFKNELALSIALCSDTPASLCSAVSNVPEPQLSSLLATAEKLMQLRRTRHTSANLKKRMQESAASTVDKMAILWTAAGAKMKNSPGKGRKLVSCLSTTSTSWIQLAGVIHIFQLYLPVQILTGALPPLLH